MNDFSTSRHSLAVNNLNHYLEIAGQAVRLGGELDRRAFREAAHQTYTKGNSLVNMVTETDRSTEKAIREFILRRFPDHRFMGEELGTDERALEGPLWIIDPIDGTSNFIHGSPHYAVSVGLAVDGEMQVSACLDVERNELFTGALGAGARLNEKPISVSRCNDLSEALVMTGFFYDRGAMMERTFSAIRTLFHAGIHGIRRSGSAVIDISWVASGRLDAFFEYTLGPWDFAPAALIAREAGAGSSDIDGNPLPLETSSVVVAIPDLLNEICSILREC